MCGIAGIFGEHNPTLVEQMCRRLAHRGPDDSGLYASRNATLGMRRLSIIDLVTGHQPIHNEEGNLSIIFNGEIYNHLQIRRRLEAAGHIFQTRSDTEVILHLYEDQGVDTPKFLRGDFAFAIWDERRRQGFLARDHLGVKPLYYARFAGRLLFASELQALRVDNRLSFTLNPHSLNLYFAYLYIPAPRTIFKECWKLPPGHRLEYASGEVRISRFWEPPAAEIPAETGEDAAVRIRSLFQEAVSIRLMSDVPLGAFLSGGIDSSAIVALMSRASSQPVKTFSIGYGREFDRYNELEFSRLIARRFATDHEEIIVEPDIEQTIRDVAGALDEPFGDSSAIPTYLVSRQAAGKVKVALSGIGGDELFGGYPRHAGVYWAAHYGRLPLQLRRILARAGGWVPEQESSRNIGRWIGEFLSEPEATLLGRYHSWITLFSAGERKCLFSEEFQHRIAEPAEDREVFLQWSAPVRHWDAVDQALYIDLVSYLPGDLLFMADRMGMARSLEIRVPFCDHRLVEAVISVPARRKIGPFKLKRLLKQILQPELPEEILKRRKQGFMIPVGAWMKKELQPLLAHYLEDERLRKQGIFKASSITRLLAEQKSGTHQRTNELWSLLVFQLWCEQSGIR